jgi:hypothetical protein
MPWWPWDSWSSAGSVEAIVNAVRANVEVVNQQFAIAAQQLTRIEAKLDLLIATETKTMATLADIAAAVTAQTTVVGSVVTLLQQLSAELKAAIANSADPAALQALVDSINANATTLANAVTANTPAA